MSRVNAALTRSLQALNELLTIAHGEGDFSTWTGANRALAALEAAKVALAAPKP